jgi:hypothetical protein
VPRIRTIKPSFFQSDDVSALPLRARLTWIGLWTQCDDQGRTKDHARLVKAAVWPLDQDVSLADVEEDLATLAEQGRIVRYQVQGRQYLEIVNWHVHQSINRPSQSNIPGPQGSMNGNSVRPHEALTDGSLGEGKGREGKGREGTRAREADPNVTGSAESRPEPPSKCPEHRHEANPPKCGDCADARRAHDAWGTEKRARIAAAPKCRLHRGLPADNCGLCRAEELSPA